MIEVSGLGKLDRKRMSSIINAGKGAISVEEAANILKISQTDTAKILSRWYKKGWVSRIKRGLYIFIPLESQTTDIPLDDPWLIADRLFAPCYMGGWSAAEYWDLTEQIFRTIVVMTVQKPRNRQPVIKGTSFLLRTIPQKNLFGTAPVWRGPVKVLVSDPARTILDMLIDPKIGGGIRPAADIMVNYLKSKNKNLGQLIQYAKQLNNGAVFKRLGFLLENLAPDEAGIIKSCLENLTQGNALLDPNLKSNRLITHWRLWIPENFNIKSII